MQPLLGQGGLQAEARDEAGALEQVAVGDDPHQGAAGFHHRQAAHAALQEQRDQLGDRRVGCDGYDIAAHDIADRLLQWVLAVAGRVLDDMDGLHDDQAVADHAPDAGQQLCHALGQIHPLDANGEVGRERLDVGGVDAAVRTVAGDGAGNRGAGSPFTAQPLENGGIEIRTVIVVAFADVDGDTGGLALHLHRNLRCDARLQCPGWKVSSTGARHRDPARPQQSRRANWPAGSAGPGRDCPAAAARWSRSRTRRRSCTSRESRR